MSWRAVARKDFLDATRSKMLWGLLVVFIGYLGIVSYLSQGGDAELLEFIELTAQGFVLFVPLVSIILGYKSIIDERESGTIALLLSLPHSRRDMVVGKFVGRTVVLAIPVLVSLLGASAVIVLLFDSFPVIDYVLFALLSVALGAAFLGISVGLSMSTTVNRRVTAGAFGAYVVLGVLWKQIMDAMLVILWRFENGVLVDRPAWAMFVQMASPMESFDRLTAALFDLDIATAYTAADAPWVVDAWVAVLVLVGWVVLPLGIGYIRFSIADL
ncbi:ABC transporter permease [Halovenus rubra]|uniref:ABC transporter permease n=2 Tax=Halovenus rubra TaxID=869890 RepID=A0ABD5X0E1_9EURY|nr:ABC transporter permease subunit [Halovenus rubra]